MVIRGGLLDSLWTLELPKLPRHSLHADVYIWEQGIEQGRGEMYFVEDCDEAMLQFL